MKNVKIVLISVIFSFVAGFFGGFLALEIARETDASGGEVLPQSYFIEESDVIDTIAEVDPSVVSIVVYEGGGGRSFFYLEEDLEEEIVGGTGFIVSSDGLILTNKHVLAGGDAKYRIILSNDTEMEAEFVSEDPFDDVGVLRILGENLDLPTVKLGDSDTVKVGQRVLAVGNALAVYGNTVTSGIISAKGRDVFALDDLGTGGENLSGLIQTDAAINFGNSGGPLVNINGEVIGMNVAVAEFANNIGFAIPINDLKPLIASVKEFGEIVRPVLGVRFIMLNEALAEVNGLKVNEGALIIPGARISEPAVIEGGSAEKAGLKEGDVVLTVNNEKLNVDNPLHKVVRNYRPGEKLRLKVLRNGRELNVDVELQSNKDL